MLLKTCNIFIMLSTLSLIMNSHAASDTSDETTRMLKEYFGIAVTSTPNDITQKWPNKIMPESIFFSKRSITVPGEKRYYATKINTLSSGFKEGAIVTGPEQQVTDAIAKSLPRYFDEDSLEIAIAQVLKREPTLAEKTKCVVLTIGQLYRMCDILMPAELLYLITDLPGCTHQGTDCNKRLALIQEHIKSRATEESVAHLAHILVPTRRSEPNF